MAECRRDLLPRMRRPTVIDVLVPVLGRPQNAQPLADSLRDNTHVEVRLLFLTSPGDDAEMEACFRTGADVLEVPGEDRQYPRKINAGFRWTHHPFVLMASDDIEFMPGWDLEALAAAESGKSVVGTNDKANRHVMLGQFSTHPLIRRSYVMTRGGSLDGPGVVLHEGYDHNYVDRELCHLAQARGEWAFAPKAVIVHHHPGWQKGITADPTYAKGRRNFNEDHALFIRRATEWGGVGLLPGEKAFLRNASIRARHEERRRLRRPRS